MLKKITCVIGPDCVRTFISVITLRQSEKVMNDQEPRRESRGRETPQQREQRLARRRERDKERRAGETPEQREQRLARRRERDREHRAGARAETPVYSETESKG